MPKRICPSLDDHSWVSDGPYSETYCMDCGLKLEDAIEAHFMQEIEEDEE
jgi:hypothetical protein